MLLRVDKAWDFVDLQAKVCRDCGRLSGFSGLFLYQQYIPLEDK